MYYVLQVAAGTENRVEEQIHAMIEKRLYGRCFHPMRHRKKRFGGEWREVHEKLFPGYVFITSDCVEDLYIELERVPMVTKLLGKDGEHFAALSDYEVEWLGQIMDLAEHDIEVPISRISVSEEDEVTILSGPLKGLEGQIKKINLHKRIAEVEVDFMNRKTIIYLGIEMVKKDVDKSNDE